MIANHDNSDPVRRTRPLLADQGIEMDDSWPVNVIHPDTPHAPRAPHTSLGKADATRWSPRDRIIELWPATDCWDRAAIDETFVILDEESFSTRYLSVGNFNSILPREACVRLAMRVEA